MSFACKESTQTLPLCEGLDWEETTHGKLNEALKIFGLPLMEVKVGNCLVWFFPLTLPKCPRRSEIALLSWRGKRKGSSLVNIDEYKENSALAVPHTQDKESSPSLATASVGLQLLKSCCVGSGCENQTPSLSSVFHTLLSFHCEERNFTKLGFT